MLIMYDFECECEKKHRFEDLVEYKQRDKLIDCKYCEGKAYRIISPVRFKLDEISGDFPTAYDKWWTRRKQKMDQEKAYVKKHGPDSNEDLHNRES